MASCGLPCCLPCSCLSNLVPARGASFTSVLTVLSVLEGFSESGDPSCVIMQSWARVEVSICTDLSVTPSLDGCG